MAMRDEYNAAEQALWQALAGTLLLEQFEKGESPESAISEAAKALIEQASERGHEVTAEDMMNLIEEAAALQWDIHSEEAAKNLQLVEIHKAAARLIDAAEGAETLNDVASITDRPLVELLAEEADMPVSSVVSLLEQG